MERSVVLTEHVNEQENLALGKTVGGFVFMNDSPNADKTTDQNEVLDWVSYGFDVRVIGFFTYEWDGDSLKEVWHIFEQGFEFESDCPL